MLGVRSGVRIAGQPSPDELAVAGHLVEGIRVDDVDARSATSRIPGSVVLDGDEIGTRPGIDGVTPRASEEEIRAGYTRDPIVPGAAGKRVRSRCADEAIVPGTAHDGSGSRRRDPEHENGENESEHAHSTGMTAAGSPSLHRGDYDPVP